MAAHVHLPHKLIGESEIMIMIIKIMTISSYVIIKSNDADNDDKNNTQNKDSKEKLNNRVYGSNHY